MLTEIYCCLKYDFEKKFTVGFMCYVFQAAKRALQRYK
jgi:hypothetical protein